MNYSKYLQPANNESNFIQANPGVTLQNMTTPDVEGHQRRPRAGLRSEQLARPTASAGPGRI